MSDQSWTLEKLTQVPDVQHAILCTGDGLVSAWSASLEQDQAERLAARCTGLLTLARNQAEEHGTGGKAVYQLLAQYEGGVLFVRGAARGTCLVVVARAQSNPALIAQEMQAMVLKMGEVNLATAQRASNGGAAPLRPAAGGTA